MRFNEKLAAQVAAYFLYRAGGAMQVLKLMKLMYLAERVSLERYGEPLTGDTLVSMDHGPVLSNVLNHMNSMIDSEPNGWEAWISDREDHTLALRIAGDPTPRLTQLSEADLEVLAHVWQTYGQMTGGQLRNHTHRNCAEWEDPNGSSLKIPYARILKAVGYKPEIADEMEKRIAAQRSVELAFDNPRF